MSGRNDGKTWGPRTWRRGAFAAALATTCVPLAVVAGSGSAEAKAGASTAIFHGSAAAYGVRVTYLVNGVPLTKTPFDGGGPTAQAVVDSGLSSSTGYAASPDPGELFASGPGLVAGVLGGGVPGVVPPITGLPSPPEYPFLVRSDASTNPQVSAGQAPVTVSAKSQPAASQSEATFGVDSAGGGGGAISTASVSYTPNGAGSAAATADLHGVTAGPLTLGHVLSKVTKTLKPNGTIVPSTTLEISGATISGTPVEMTPDGFTQLNGALKSALAQSGVVVEFVAAQEFPESGRIIAPGIKISMPIPQSPQIPGVGQFSGTATYFIGFATAEITPAGGIPTSAGTSGGSTNITGSNTTGSNSGSNSGSTSTGGAAALPATGVDAAGSPVAAVLNHPAAGAPAPLPGVELSGAAGVSPAVTQFEPVATSEFNGKDVRSVYLLAVAAVVAAIASGLRIVRPGAVK
jgi:hypothetical protein